MNKDKNMKKRNSIKFSPNKKINPIKRVNTKSKIINKSLNEKISPKKESVKKDNKELNIKQSNEKPVETKEIQQKPEKIKIIPKIPRVKLEINLKDLNINNIMNLKNKLKDIQKLSNKEEDEKSITKKFLSDKQNTIMNSLKELKDNKNYIENSSLNNINTPNSLIENNLAKEQLRKIKDKEKELKEKLSSIKFEKDKFYLNENIKINKNNLKDYLTSFKKERDLKTRNFMLKLNQFNKEYKSNNDKKEEFFRKLEEKFQKEDEEEKNLIEKEKIEFLSEERKKEKSLVLRRKFRIDQKIKNIMRSRNNQVNHKQNYVYLQMENDFKENEKNLLNEVNSKRKAKLMSPEETEEVNKKIIEAKNKMLEKAEKRKKELHKMWHSRSLVLQKLQSPALPEKQEFEENKIVINVDELVKNKKEYIKKNIKLPPISIILQKEIENRFKKNNSYTSSVNKNKKLIFNSGNNSFSSEDKKSNGQVYKKDNNISKNKLNSISNSTQAGKGIQNIKLYKNNISRNILRKPNYDINYLEEIKQKRLLKSNEIENNKVSKELTNLDNDINIKNQIEVMESKYKRDKQLLKLQGGYLKNKELGDNMNELLIDSIQKKLLLIENIDNNK